MTAAWAIIIIGVLSTVIFSGICAVAITRAARQRSPHVSKAGVLAELDESELRHLAADRGLILGSRMEILGFVASQGYAVIPAHEFHGRAMVDMQAWNNLVSMVEMSTVAANKAAQAVEIRNVTDSRWARDWINRGGEE